MSKLLIFILSIFILSNIHTTNATERLDRYYRDFFAKNGINVQKYEESLGNGFVYSNIVVSSPLTFEKLIGLKFNNIIFICQNSSEVSDCLDTGLLQEGYSIEKKYLQPNSENEYLYFYIIKSLGRTIYVVDKSIIDSVYSANILLKYFNSVLNTDTVIKRVNYDLLINLIFEIFTYLVVISLFYLLIFVFRTRKLFRSLNFFKSKSYITVQIISLYILFFIILFQPLVFFIYAGLFGRPVSVDLFKEIYLINISNFGTNNSKMLLFYIFQYFNLVFFVLSIIFIVLPTILNKLKNYKINIKTLLFFLTTSLITLFLLMSVNKNHETSITIDKNLLNLNKNYYTNSILNIGDSNLTKDKAVFVDNYLVNHPQYNKINNNDLKNLKDFNQNLIVLSKNIDDAVNNIFFLLEKGIINTDSSVISSSKVMFYPNLSYESSYRYYLHLSIECKYYTQPFTYALYFYTKHQIENNINPEKINFYNFPGCEQGEVLYLVLPIERFNIYNQDTIIVLRSREQEANKNIDTSGLNYNFVLYKNDEMLNQVPLNKDMLKSVTYLKITDVNSSTINVYSASNKEYSIVNKDTENFNVSKIIKDLYEKNLVGNKIYLWSLD